MLVSRACGVFVLCIAPLVGLRGAVADDRLPAGRFGLVAGVRNNHDSLGKAYGGGFLLGIEAGYHPSRLQSPWSFGVSWTTLVRGWIFASDQSLVERTVGVTEMSFGLRVRRRIGVKPRFLFATGGGSFLRTDTPLPPDASRNYLGPYAGAGYEQFLFGAGFLTAEARYSMFPSGPESLTLLVSFVAGVR